MTVLIGSVVAVLVGGVLVMPTSPDSPLFYRVNVSTYL